MACHEIAALRLGLMGVIGIEDEAERQHELAELGEAARAQGPLSAALAAASLGSLRTAYQAAVAELEERVASTPPGDPRLPYYRTLIVLTKKTELELDNRIEDLTRWYRDLERMHDFVHEIYPVELS